MPTTTVRCFLPRKPEHFAYVIPPTGRFYEGTGGGFVVEIKDVPTWSHRSRRVWWLSIGVRLVHDDGTPWTDEDWDKRHPDLHFVDEYLGKHHLRRIAAI